MRKGISPLIAAVILIAFVIAVAAVASDFFTGFFKGRQSEISEKGETVVECGVANLDIQEDFLECSAPNWDSMVARWHLDEGTGQYINDSTPNNNDGTLGSTTGSDNSDPSWVNGVSGGGLNFDNDTGTDDYVEIPSSSSLNPTSGITVCAWRNYHTRMWVNTDELKKLNQYYLDSGYDHKVQFGVYVNGSAYWTGQEGNLDNEWIFWCGVYSSNDHVVRLYENAVERQNNTLPDGLSTYQLDTTTNPLKLKTSQGRNYTTDEIRIYDRALSQSQIEYLYSHGTQLRFSILNKGQTSLGKKFGVTAIINGTSVSGSVSLDNSLDKAEIQTVTPLENISTAGKLEKVRIASKACGSVKDVARPEDVYC